MRTYISPIGYNSTSITRPVLSRGLDDGDEVVLLRPRGETDTKRAQEAIQDVERMLTEIEPTVSTTTERITHDDFPRAVLECSDVIRAADGDRIVNLGGGARDILVPFTIAALVHVPLIHTTLFFSDIDGSVREWEIPRLVGGIPGKTQQTLLAIEQSGKQIPIPELTETTNQSKSTVTRHVNQLEESGLVETETRGKTKHVNVLLAGRLLLRAVGSNGRLD